jgi:hypothetical protein
LLAILKTIDGMEAVERNRGGLPPEKQPGLILLDADEEADEPVQQGSGRLTLAPSTVVMAPEIYVIMDQRDPPNERIGEDMDALRVMILKAIFADQPLQTLLGANGGIRYLGCETDMASGRSMQGQMHIRTAYRYVLRASEL